MKFLNFGSLNLDYVYQVEHMVGPGETLASADMQVFCGGKGLNQSIALARAGAEVYHAGLIGEEGRMLLEELQAAGVDCRFVRIIGERTGHAIIQVDETGQNCILLYGGANRCLSSEYIDEVLAAFGEGDVLVLQNEVNRLDEIVDKAYARGMEIVLNPSPFDDGLKAVDFNKISTLILNEVEGEQMTGETEAAKAAEQLSLRYPKLCVVMTLGEGGASIKRDVRFCHEPAFRVDAVDTTAAGDTFTGYFLAAQAEGMEDSMCLQLAQKAASVAVTRQGAAPSIPLREEVVL